MLSNQVLQNCIDGTKSITRREICVMELGGKIAASTNYDEFGDDTDNLELFVASPAESQLVHGSHYFKIFNNGVAEYILKIIGEDDETYRIGKVTSFHIQHLISAYKERYDKDNFLKNLLMDNFLLVDIYSRAKKLGIEIDQRRVVYLMEFDIEEKIDILETVRELLPAHLCEYVTSTDERLVILVRDLDDREGQQEIEGLGRRIYECINTDTFTSVRMSIGTVAGDLKNVSQSFKEAKMALEVSKIFGAEGPVVNYETLGIGRLIYQLPVNLCRMFINEVLHGVTMEQFDEESLVTVGKFFENNLNVSETSRQLFIHRNTLVYRLDKLQKMTGLDLRNFDDAIVFKITMMVAKYLDYVERHVYK